MARRSRAADGQFVYAVTSTGVFCRPSCPSRRPRPDRVRFFASAQEAERAGFRPCRRCHPAGDGGERRAAGDAAIQRAARYLVDHAGEPVSLERLARVSGMSRSHLQRRFTRALGLSPREYQAAARAARFRHALRAGRDVTGAVYDAGYGSPSRVYERPPTGAIPPSSYRRGGAGVAIGFVTLRCDLGVALVAASSRGICAVRLGDTAEALEAELRAEFPHAEIRKGGLPRVWIERIAACLRGVPAPTSSLPLDIRGTAFQWRVWRALQAIPFGETRSYGAIARAIGEPSAARAVARACAANPVGLVVPCHRVVPLEGGPGGYRWGADRKARLLRREAQHRQRKGAK
jgi:AraC family transcriptional regulator of adaptative response/methylated-DNA-[protein]-cysteine methyltransferase